MYFITRQDEMIKTSGYRVSPTEVEEIIHASGMTKEAVAFGVNHEVLGQAIVVAAEPSGEQDTAALIRYCQQNMANFMVPAEIDWYQALPRNPNGKIDRASIKQQTLKHLAEANPSE